MGKFVKKRGSDSTVRNREGGRGIVIIASLILNREDKNGKNESKPYGIENFIW